MVDIFISGKRFRRITSGLQTPRPQPQFDSAKSFKLISNHNNKPISKKALQRVLNVDAEIRQRRSICLSFFLTAMLSRTRANSSVERFIRKPRPSRGAAATSFDRSDDMTTYSIRPDDREDSRTKYNMPLQMTELARSC